MTIPNEAHEAIYQRLEDNIGGVAFTFENEDFDSSAHDEWVRLTIRTNARAQETLAPIGARRYFSNSSILVQCYTKIDQGRKAADDLARTITEIFEGVRFSGVNCNNSITRESPPSGIWLQFVVEIEFTYDETR